MKKTIYIVALLSLMFGGCDKVEEPYLVPIGTGGENKVRIHIELLNNLTGSYNLNVFIVESGIISPQKNDEANIGPKPDWLDYEHNHMLRGSLTGTWGFALAENPTAGMHFNNEYSFAIEDDWDIQNLDFLVFVTNNEDQRIVQAAEISLQGQKDAVKVVMLEEFTGHLCVNCPEATLLAHDLKETYGEQLVLLSIHAGELAEPSGAPYENDFRTDAGNGIYNEFLPLGVPTGMISRVKYDGSFTLFKDSWEPAIQELINQPQDMSIKVTVELAE